MDLTEGIKKRLVRTGQILAFLAVLFLAFNPHSLHALSDQTDGHSHFGFLCNALDTERSSSDSEGGTPSPHADCIHHFDPLVQSPAEQPARDVSVEESPPHFGPARQQILTFDPPPPRVPS